MTIDNKVLAFYYLITTKNWIQQHFCNISSKKKTTHYTLEKFEYCTK